MHRDATQYCAMTYMGTELKTTMGICICIMDSFCCATETNTTLYINYTLTKINLEKKQQHWWMQWLRQWRICLQCGRPGFDSWVRKIPWRREWQPTPIFLPGESHEQRSLVGYHPWGHKESDTFTFKNDQTKWSQTQKDRYHMISLMWNLIFKNCTNEFIYKIETDLQISKTNLWLSKGKCVGGGINQELGMNIHTQLYIKTDSPIRTCCIAQGILLNILW